MIRLNRSNCPLVGGWQAAVFRFLTPMNPYTSVENSLTKCGQFFVKRFVETSNGTIQ